MSWKKKLEKKIREYLAGYTACHDFFHLQRVHNYAMEIAKNLPKKFSRDADVLWAASYLHDIGYRHHEGDDKNHHRYGMDIAKKWLSDIGFPKEKIVDVIEVIRLHDNLLWDENAEETNHIETQIVQDADRIDALGAVGIARISYYFGERGYPIYNSDKVEDSKKVWLDHSLVDQIRRDPLKKWENLNFACSKKLSAKRNKFIRQFYTELKKELGQHQMHNG